MEFRNPGAVIEETIRTRKLKAIFNRLQHQELLLDIACGPRPYFELYADKFNRSIGIEHPDSPFPKAKIDIYCLADQIPLEDNCADAILETEMLHDMSEPKNILKEAGRLLKPGGLLILTTPFLVPVVDGKFDHYRYTRFGLEYLLTQSGFTDIQIAPVGDLFSTGISLFIKPWLRVWNSLSKKLRIKAIYSLWNPFLWITVILPQLAYLMLAELPGFRDLFRKFSYGSIGYVTTATKPAG